MGIRAGCLLKRTPIGLIRGIWFFAARFFRYFGLFPRMDFSLRWGYRIEATLVKGIASENAPDGEPQGSVESMGAKCFQAIGRATGVEPARWWKQGRDTFPIEMDQYEGDEIEYFEKAHNSGVCLVMAIGLCVEVRDQWISAP